MPTAIRVPATRAARDFSELLRRVGDGREEIVIERHRKPVARMSPASNSPTRWCDLYRAVRRIGRPDKYLEADLAAFRGRKVPPSRQRWSAVTKTALLDTSVLVRMTSLGAIDALQRVSISSASVAEILALADLRGPTFGASRRRYVAALCKAAPCVSFDATVAREFRVRPRPRPAGDFIPFIVATSAALEWPLLTVDIGAFEGFDVVVIGVD